jgi:hypothetical protein
MTSGGNTSIARTNTHQVSGLIRLPAQQRLQGVCRDVQLRREHDDGLHVA